MTSVGELLHRERTGQKRELAEIAEELCITQRYLRAIEKDDINSLPGLFFYKSFVRQYAKILGVDAAKIDCQLAEATAAQEGTVPVEKTQESVPRPVLRGLDPIVEASNRNYFGDRRMGVSVAALVAVLLGCTTFYGWWNRAPKVTLAKAPIAGDMALTVTPVPVSASTPTAVPAVSEPPPAASAETQGSTLTIPVSDSTDVNQVVLNLNATEKTWLSITSDGKVIFSGILEPSQTKILHGHEEAKIKVGNAGGLEVRWNGKPIGPIGPRGQVRVIKFTPENFQIISPSTTL